MKTRIIVTCAFAAMLLAGCAKKEGAADSGGSAMADSMKTAVTETAALFDAGKVDELGKYIGENFVDHNLMPGMKPGLVGMKEMCTELHAAFPDMKTTVEDMRVDGNVITARYKISGTNSGAMMGMPATNKKMTDISMIEMMRWENGKFVERWGLFDEMTMMKQLGKMPEHSPGDHAAPPEAKK